MSRRRTLLLVTALAAALAASSGTPAPGSARRVAGSGEIVFVSSRDPDTAGQIYALAPGRAPRDLFRAPGGELELATSPTGSAYAFWSSHAGRMQLMVSRGSGAPRSVAVGGPAGVSSAAWQPVFSPDGTRLLIPYVPAHSTIDFQLALADVRSGAARNLRTPCRDVPAWSPTGSLFSCAAGNALDSISVSDLRGHVIFTTPGRHPLWSSDGRLAVASATHTAVLSVTGIVLARLNGVAQAWSPDGRTLALVRPHALVLAEPGRPTPIHTVAAGEVFWAAFTPDGREIAYDEGPFPHARIEPVAGGPPRPLAGGIGEGTWSRDGRYAFATVSGPTMTIEVGDRFGRRARVVGRFPFDDHGLSTRAWLGDGSQLLFNVFVPGHTDLWTMGTDGSGQRRLTNTGERISEPAWSADGTQLAYGSASFKGGLCGFCGGNVAVADAQGREVLVIPGAIAGQESADGSASWSPSGVQIAVMYSYAGGIFVVDRNGSGRDQISADGSSPAWSPDGSTIAFILGGAVWAIDPTGANRRQLLPASVSDADSIAWSPDGRELAFSTETGVYVSAADGTGAARRVVAAVRPGRPSFSPDGSQLAFAAGVDGAQPYRAIYTVGVDGSGLRQLTTGPFDSSDPAWRP